MSTINDGGPAFPESISDDGPWGGMTLRDYFAAKAMILQADEGISVEAISEVIGIDRSQHDWQTHWPMYVANRAYAIADAMLKAREPA